MKLGIIAVAVVGCGKGTDSSASSGSGSGSGSVVAAVTPVADATAAIDAAPPKLAAARCDDPCLFLIDTPIDKVEAAFAASCPNKKTKDLPFECKQIDYVRNCIYAAHGVVYKKQKWKKLFAAKTWYEPHPEVHAKTIEMPEVEHANVHELYMRGKACKKGMSITGADYERLAAWFKKRSMPPHNFKTETNEVGGAPEEVDGKAMRAWLDSTDGKLGKQFASGLTLVAYEDADSLGDQAKVLDLMHVTDPTSLRIISVSLELAHGDEEQPGSEDLTLRFFYGKDDKLLAIAGDHSSVWD